MSDIQLPPRSAWQQAKDAEAEEPEPESTTPEPGLGGYL